MCKIKNCVKPNYRVGMCRMHYARLLKNGDPNNPGKIIIGNDLKRFVSKTKAGPLLLLDYADLGCCWDWIGKKILTVTVNFSL